MCVIGTKDVGTLRGGHEEGIAIFIIELPKLGSEFIIQLTNPTTPIGGNC